MNPATTPSTLHRAVADFLAENDGLPTPASVSVYHYGRAQVTLHLHGTPPELWAGMTAWADRYGTRVHISPAVTDPASLFALTEIEAHGVRYEVACIIRCPEACDNCDLHCDEHTEEAE